MHPLLIPVVMPLLLATLMMGEYGLGRLLGTPTHSGEQTLNNLAVTIVYRIYGVAFAIAPFFGYASAQQHLGLWEWSPLRLMDWIGAWLILDFTMYWRHRAAHRIAALWSIHAVHHQSEEYNTTVTARASMFQDTVLVVMPLALLGVPLSMGMTVFAFISIVTFFSHTTLIGTLGWLDKVFVTPSVHRVHHGRNERYLDKNYGASLVLWDHLFGTYAAETEEVEYGVLDGLTSYDPLENNLSPWKTLIAKAQTAPTFTRGLLTFIMPPSWEPTSGKPRSFETASPPRKEPAAAPLRLAIATAIFMVATGIQMGIAQSYTLTPLSIAGIALFGLALLGISGAMLERGHAPWHRGPQS